MIEVKVLHLALDEKNQFPVVILETLDRAKRLPIWIGPPEANAIAMELQKKRFQRPLTHDLIVSMFTGCGIKVPRVEIVDLRENTFFAKIYLEKDGEIIAVDARPSDSLALALKAKAKVGKDSGKKQNRNDRVNWVGIGLDHAVISGAKVIAKGQYKQQGQRYKRNRRHTLTDEMAGSVFGRPKTMNAFLIG